MLLLVFTALLHPVALASVSLCRTGSTDCWENRMIYQVITDRFARSDDSDAGCDDLTTYCGGTWAGIIKHMDYIQGLGAEAVWIGPVLANSPGGYMGYWPISTSRINPVLGGAEELQALVDEVHRRGMLILVGFTANAMGQHWSDIKMMDPPWNDTNMYHGCTECMAAGGGKGALGCVKDLCDCWIVDWDDPAQQDSCQVFGMPDVDEDKPFVYDALLHYVRDLVNRFGIDGVRLDACPYMTKPFWRDFSVASGVMSIGEVLTGNDAIVSQYVKDKAMDSVLNYPLYFQLLNCFTLANAPGDTTDPKSRWGLNSLASFLAMQAETYGEAVKILGNFASNHDNARLASLTPDMMLQQALMLTVMTSVGMPIIYYGCEQGMWDNRSKFGFDAYREPLWPTKYPTNSTWYRWLATIGRMRQTLPKEDFAHSGRIDLWTAPDLYVYMRGKVLVAVTNVGVSLKTMEQDIHTPLEEGTHLLSAFDEQDSVRVGRNGSFRIRLHGGESKMYVPFSAIAMKESLPQSIFM